MSNLCFINFSPRQLQSTSYYLYTLLKLQADTYHVNDFVQKNQYDLLDKYTTIIIGTPVYVDSLPSRGLLFLEEYSDYINLNKQEKNLYGLTCCGFPESKQTHIVLDILSHFAEAASFNWQGGLGLGAGEFILNSKAIPMDSKFKRPLKTKLDDLSQHIQTNNHYGVQFCDPMMPKWLFIKASTSHWYKAVKANGLTRKDLSKKIITP